MALPLSLDELLFELKDIELFKIPDTKTRIATVQNYFFPRLEILLRHTMGLIEDIYEVNPYERTTFVYHPSNRKSARVSADFDWVHMGLSGKRRIDRELTIKRRDGKHFFHHPTYLTYEIDLHGAISVELMWFRQYVDPTFISRVATLYEQNFSALSPVLNLNFISHTKANDFIDIKNVFIGDHDEVNCLRFISPKHFFPVDADRGLYDLALTFSSLYPLLDAVIALGEGETPRLAHMLDKLKEWWQMEVPDNVEEAETESIVSDIPDLDSYSFVRAGTWWSVLARDNWTCCSCGRNSREDGIVLEVDHILPRSKGGSNDPDNLQTLCKKCNIGKSNKDDTDLRRTKP